MRNFSALINFSKEVEEHISLLFQIYNFPNNNFSKSLALFRYYSTAANTVRSIRKKREYALNEIGLPATRHNSHNMNLFDIEKAYLILASVFGTVISPKKASLLIIIFQKLNCSLDNIIKTAEHQKQELYELCKMGLGCCDEYLAYDLDFNLRELKDILPIHLQVIGFHDGLNQTWQST